MQQLGGGQAINLAVPNSKTRRGRVSDVAQTLDTNMQQYTIAERGRYEENGKIKQKIEPRHDGLTNTLTSVEKDNRVVIAKTVTEYGIRRLTPKECERLQAYPDGWTEKGVDNVDQGEYQILSISDRQRYKVLGNGVTTNVVYAIMKLLKTI